ncbi:putative epoxidase LasC [Nocardia cerradoensis]|uniref:Putative epoxidase LasC n=2 Tax=Nocardia cerradoensis TaxID=85688 RepID=A0A231GYB7_9NOCA|nr:putative epoxidase LasC [Nocardia cerradoensis]
MSKLGQQAIVCGASMSGLLAARVLSDFYEQVTLVERDPLPDGPEQRRGVPQARHFHALLSTGSNVLGQLFPGLLEELVSAGANVLANEPSRVYVRLGRHELSGSDKYADPASLVVYQPSRPFLDSHVRRRVRAIDNVKVLDSHGVVAPMTDRARRVTGARVVNRHTGEETGLTAELVVDAMGRSAHTPVFLDNLGCERPIEQRYPVHLSYASQFLRVPPDMVGDKLGFSISPLPERPVGVVAVAYEHDTWILTLFGVDGHKLPHDLPGVIDCAAQFAPPSLIAALRSAEPLGSMSAQHYPASTWRRYDKMRQFPAGLLVMGDAICSFNPVYMQGMTMAALQAVALRNCLTERDADLSRRFFKATAKQIGPVWRGNRFTDFTVSQGDGWRRVPRRLLNWPIDKAQEAAANDPAVAEAVLRVMHFVDPPARLARPSFLRRLVAANRRAGMATKRRNGGGAQSRGNERATGVFDIDRMPRGGPDASWLDRRLQTDRLEYLDRDDVDARKRSIIRSLERGERAFGIHRRLARIVLDEVADVRDPKILELGSGHGGLSRALLTMHPTAHVTVTDIEPASVAAIAAGDLGSHPRATVREMDATAIDAPDGAYDLAVFALSLHHLPPPPAARVFAEGTRAADKLLIIDLSRAPSLLHLVMVALALPLTIIPYWHDALISSLRAYSPSALRALARYADPSITLELRRQPPVLPGSPQIAVAGSARKPRSGPDF